MSITWTKAFDLTIEKYENPIYTRDWIFNSIDWRGCKFCDIAGYKYNGDYSACTVCPIFRYSGMYCMHTPAGNELRWCRRFLIRHKAKIYSKNMIKESRIQEALKDAVDTLKKIKEWYEN